MSAASARPRVIYSENGPEAPYPLQMEGTSATLCTRIFQQHKEADKTPPPPQLGIPTANLPVDASQTPWISDVTSGVYFGYASLALPSTHPDYVQSSSAYQIYPMVMSIGFNPYYKNTVRSAEVHVLHKFSSDFYDVPMRLLILGFIREEKDYNGLEALIEDINIDCDVARQSLNRDAWTPKEGVVGSGKGTLDGTWLVRA
ncbi:hypothetical protein SCAR479_03232 [Seiridium cardinale]|uniref:Riboflavin kinase n=1 Tax=Seiridium cardinale TaxID=138064 RepID=A0ABR2Y236_9PEZI